MCFQFIPAVWASEAEILNYESLVIRRLQAPTQQMSNQLNGGHFDRFRLWPRLRHKPAASKEQELNLSSNLPRINVHAPAYVADGRHCESFGQLMPWCRHRLGICWEFIITVMHTVALASWLSVYLADRCTCLDYKAVWRCDDPLRRVLSAWHASLKFDHVRRMRVQRKIFRFLETSGLLATRRCILRIPTHSVAVVQQAKRAVRRIVAHIRRGHHNELGVFVQHRVRIVQAVGPKLQNLLESHLNLAKQFEPERLMQLSREQRRHFDDRRDVHKSNQYGDVPLPDDQCFLSNVVSEQLAMIPFSKRMPYILDTCMSCVQQCNWSAGQPSDVRQYVDIEWPAQDEVAVIFEKNMKSRAFWSKDGYC